MMSKNDISAYMSEWMRDREESPIVMSSRIRLARNLENHVHPLMFLSEQDGFRIINDVQDALPDLSVQRLDSMDQQSKYKLVAKHLISPELIRQPASAVLLNEDESLSIMINEEDHIRIQAMGNDLSLSSLYEKASKIDDQLDSELDVSFDETLGYLTTCPTNIGTGMRASVMLHLPGLTIMKRMNRIAQTINRFGFTIRGIYGEGSQVYGHIYQISNQLTLGKTEEEIIESLSEVVQQIINEEMQIRERLNRHNHIETLDRVYRSLGILKYSRLISMEEASLRLSEVKLGLDLGYIELEDFKFNELMVAIQSPFLLDEEDDRAVNEKRADILREHIN
ncbi:protein arginine kinase [Staphylococcus shinii]|uniref:Protein-arginine kinase n=2 Tax=Staphylococcus TaxID=1279 RepID=A0A418II86_9STAP|nr:protein arginine kinase [Staphylococcus shinii]PKI14390.1 protein arginine kinase [Staphylococcus shinii]PTI03439.1 protein arginine kinase [Staphylococcus shinii]PTI64590.1 protein arginine kinase [Staphylococcus shinii]RIM99113.1 protein arginine kinase [Staphylococcus shinii]